MFAEFLRGFRGRGFVAGNPDLEAETSILFEEGERAAAALLADPHSRLHHSLVVAKVAESVRNAVSRMIEANVGVLAVYEQERLVGILSEHDVITRVVAEGLNPDDTAVASVMTRVN